MDMLIFVAGILVLPAVVLLDTLDYHRWRATMPAPHQPATPREVREPGPLPGWVTAPASGPVQWSFQQQPTTTRRPARLPEVLRFEAPPRPELQRQATALTSSVARAWDAWEAHLASLMLPEVA